MDCVINLDKPKGITSQDAVTAVKRALRVKKAGHAGTLDPIATGVLLVGTGEATKISRFLADLDKEYLALVKLGERTDTLDAEGKVIERAQEVSVGPDAVTDAVRKFTGVIRQRPPMYSAVKMNGRPLYRLARQGIEVERPERTVEVKEIEVTRFEPPWLGIRVICTKGTYIRTLCDDIGLELGVGGHVVELRRTRIGHFNIVDSASLDDLRAGGQAEELPGKGGICTIDAALMQIPEMTLTAEQFRKARNGMAITYSGIDIKSGTFLRLRDPSGDLFAIGKTFNGCIKIERMLHIGRIIKAVF